MFELFKRKKEKSKKSAIYKKRNFSAAIVNNLTASWSTSAQDIDSLIKNNLKQLRSRSREQANNNDYLIRFLSLVKQNVIGQGVSFQSRVVNPDGKQDKSANDAIEKAWKDFSKRSNCDIQERLSLIEMTKLYISTVAEDGEVIVRLYVGKEAGKYGLSLRLYDPDTIDFDYNEDFKNGDYVRFGIHFFESGKRKGYWFKSSTPFSVNRVFVPASEIIHEYICLKVGQKRGLPWSSTALLRLNMLGGYEEAALINARQGASKMGFYTTSDGDQLIGEEDDDGSLVMNAEPGTFEQLPAGVDFKTYDPAYPSGEFDGFVRSSLRGIASGLNVSYHNLANDLSQVNYSSARIGELSDREVWKALQDWVVESFLTPVFELWLRNALLRGEIKSASGRRFPYNMEKFNAPSFQGRRWQWVDPLKEANSQKLLTSENLKSKSAVIREQGQDPEDVWMEIQRENERMKELGIETEQQLIKDQLEETEDDEQDN